MDKLYRFGLFGLSGSGKSTILAAMSLAHAPHPEGMTVTWLRVPPAGSCSAAALHQYEEGTRILTEARKDMWRGEYPPATLPGPPVRYRFDFTARSSCRGVKRESAVNDEGSAGGANLKYAVEFIDYSGELLHPGASAESFAKELRAHLHEMDALFILAEAPLPGREGEYYEAFEMLQQAFAYLEAERKRSGEPVQTPVAVLFNKWDRLHPDDHDPAARAVHLEAFLNADPKPPHRSLVDHVQGAVSEGCCWRFAVSAFGRNRREKRVDKDQVEKEVELPPLSRPLPSFGLEDPLVWAAQLRDEIDVSVYEQEAGALTFASLAPWLGLDLFGPAAPLRLYKRGSRLASRFHAAKPTRDRVRRLAAKALRTFTVRAACLFCLILAVLLAAESGYDFWRVQQVRADFARPDATAAELDARQVTLASYVKAPPYRHAASRLFVLSRSDAERLASAVSTRREALAWEPVRALDPEVLSQQRPAEAYLEKFPNGEHASEANAIVERARPLRMQRENDDHIEGVRSKIRDLSKTDRPDPQAVLREHERLGRLPHPDQRLPRHDESIKKVREEGALLLSALNAAQKEERLRSLLKARQFEEAGAFVKGLVRAGAANRDFAKVMMAAGEPLAAELETGRHWDDLRKLHLSVKQGWEDNHLLDAPKMTAIDAWRRAANRGWDKELYEQVRAYKDSARCDNYLSSWVPQERRSMTKEVKEYKKYLSIMSGELPLKLYLDSVSVGGIKKGKDLVLEYRLIDYFKRKIDFTTSANHLFRPDPDMPIVNAVDGASMADKIELEVALFRVAAGDNVDLGKCTWRGPVSDLRRREIELPLTEGYEPGGVPTKVLFDLTGIPDAPPLPPYPEN